MPPQGNPFEQGYISAGSVDPERIKDYMSELEESDRKKYLAFRAYGEKVGGNTLERRETKTYPGLAVTEPIQPNLPVQP